MARYIVVGRHQFTPFQEKLLKQAGLEQEVYRFQVVNDVREVIEKAKELGVSDVVIQALPPQLLFQLWQLASRNGITLYLFEMDYANARIISDPSEAKENEVLIPAREGGYRAVPVKDLVRVRKVIFQVDTEPVAL